jgi:hypothetical protein
VLVSYKTTSIFKYILNWTLNFPRPIYCDNLLLQLCKGVNFGSFKFYTKVVWFYYSKVFCFAIFKYCLRDDLLLRAQQSIKNIVFAFKKKNHT